MIRIGLIGEIGSGKTFVGKCFGFPMFNADLEVKKIYKTNKKCFKKLNKKFPKNIKHFPIKKEEIKKIINKSNLKILSKVVHQYVRVSLKKFLKKHYKKKYVILDIPLLIENKLYKKSDIIIGIKAPKNSELFQALVGPIPPDAQLHDALADVRITCKSYRAAKNAGWW